MQTKPEDVIVVRHTANSIASETDSTKVVITADSIICQAKTIEVFSIITSENASSDEVTTERQQIPQTPTLEIRFYNSGNETTKTFGFKDSNIIHRRDERTDDSKKEELEQVIMKLINEIVKQPLPEQSITILPAMVRELIRLWEI